MNFKRWHWESSHLHHGKVIKLQLGNWEIVQNHRASKGRYEEGTNITYHISKIDILGQLCMRLEYVVT